jgi:2,3-bisphosphoglycerate-independent phosphoglycerate mutase
MSDKHHDAPRRPVVLIILDGFGANPSKRFNAVAMANTPRFDEYFMRHPHTVLQASGHAVGLPDGQMGNSEVGHTILGCGAVIRQDLVLIDDAIADGSFFTNEVLLDAIGKAAQSGKPLHLAGMVSDGGVHSHIRHLLALIELCKRRGVKPLVHMITDGRDTAPKCALNYLTDLENALGKAGGAIASVSGRYYAMDRDSRWDRTEKAFRAMVHCDGLRAETPAEAINAAYERGEGDEFITPTILPAAQPLTGADALVYFNFRKDRPRQMVSALYRSDFNEFDRGNFEPIAIHCMMEYDQWFGQPFAFRHDRPAMTLAQVVSAAGLRQFHCAETEKYAHVTYFFNGGRGDEFTGEDRLIVSSPKVATYDLQPEMSAREVADSVIEAIESTQYALIVVNFANGDMVGHTAVQDAVIRAVETLDTEVGRVLDAACAKHYSVILTADHGNCDEMVDPITGAPQTQHTVYPVPCLVIDKVAWRLGVGAGIASISPTVLHLMGLPRPDAMSAPSLLLGPAQT